MHTHDGLGSFMSLLKVNMKIWPSWFAWFWGGFWVKQIANHLQSSGCWQEEVEVVFVCWRKIQVILSHVDFHFTQHHLLKRFSFLCWMLLACLLEIIWSYMHGFTSGSYILFHWSICLSLWQYQTIAMVILLIVFWILLLFCPSFSYRLPLCFVYFLVVTWLDFPSSLPFIYMCMFYRYFLRGYYCNYVKHLKVIAFYCKPKLKLHTKTVVLYNSPPIPLHVTDVTYYIFIYCVSTNTDL